MSSSHIVVYDFMQRCTRPSQHKILPCAAQCKASPAAWTIRLCVCHRTPSVQLLNFVEVSDGRVSRLHCVFRQEPSSADSDTRQPMAEPDCEASTSAVYADGPKVLLMDCSTNGTFVNGAMASSQGLGTPLQDGDRVSLVLSVTPLIEQYFIFHAGEASPSLFLPVASAQGPSFHEHLHRWILASASYKGLKTNISEESPAR